VELWLETKPPEEATRAAMFQRWSDARLPGHEGIDHALLASRSPGFTPADIRRAMGDARLLYARDCKAGRPLRETTAYALEAIDALIAMRDAMASLLADETLRFGATMQEMAA
jgi:transitional endoplasmic reticulum ATPase